MSGQFTIDALSGPVGIYEATDMVAQYGIYYLMKWAGMLSINLGIMNLLSDSCIRWRKTVVLCG